ncbi:MAG TPA: LytTR family DNA-binding domain-containing protein [Candidatus Baltobacteraceae bacterium]|nr:LytTR family DNA-binding domain-containing protein [Candidatus Baltobacteraceae bacterium]
MSALRALIVDDEPHVRSELAYALKASGEDIRFEECSTALEALARLQSGTFDIVFLDIRMPGLSGIEAMQVIDKLPQRPQVAFVTAHDDHAIEAFEHEAVDYLLKPVSAPRLAKTLARVRARKSEGPAAAATARFPVDLDGRTMLIPPAEIRYVAAAGHDVTIQTFERAFRYKGTLSECASRLGGLLRVHRAYLVNPQHVVEVRPFFAGTYTLVTDDKHRSEVPVSRAFAKTVRTAFHL